MDSDILKHIRGTGTKIIHAVATSIVAIETHCLYHLQRALATHIYIMLHAQCNLAYNNIIPYKSAIIPSWVTRSVNTAVIFHTLPYA